jgi:hypothetical protein
MNKRFRRTVRVLASAAMLVTNLATLPAAAAQPAFVHLSLTEHDI